MNQAEPVLIRCEMTGKGMFPTEVVVTIHAADGRAVNFLADESLLSGNDPVRIRATRLGMEDDVSVCLLPTEDTETGSRWVRVRDKDLLVA